MGRSGLSIKQSTQIWRLVGAVRVNFDVFRATNNPTSAPIVLHTMHKGENKSCNTFRSVGADSVVYKNCGFLSISSYGIFSFPTKLCQQISVFKVMNSEKTVHPVASTTAPITSLHSAGSHLQTQDHEVNLDAILSNPLSIGEVGTTLTDTQKNYVLKRLHFDALTSF